MPTRPFLPEGRQSPRTRSPDGTGNDRKRRRKVLSCYDCRKRKLQCDRSLPACGRCTKAGQAANCLYLEDAADVPVRDAEGIPGPASASVSARLPSFPASPSRPLASSALSGILLARLEFQDGRIKQLEAALARAGTSSRGLLLPPTPESIGTQHAMPLVQEKEATLLRGGSFKTQFHGNTHPGALVVRLPELRVFTREAFEQFPALSRIKEEMASLEDRVQYAGSEYRVVSDAQLKALLPPKSEVDPLVKLYLDTYGAMYHIIHLPSFWVEYNTLWQDLEVGRAHFVALVLVMSAAAECLTTAQPWLYAGNSSTAREKAVTCLATVDGWLLSQSQKHVGALDFQIRVLLLLAKQVAARKFKRTWTDTGSVLRFCMAAGFHRTPDLIRKPTTLLDKELRKRIWAAVTELELQAAFDRGMPSSTWAAQCDCPAPSHLSDDDVNLTTEILPPPRLWSEFNNSSYLCLSAESFMLRQTLHNYLNNIRQPMSFDESKRFTEEIEAHLQAIPEWTGPGSEIPRVALSISLRQYLLVLHDRQLRLALSKPERDFSRMVLLDTASTLIETHASLTSQGVYALELLCTDQLRAALSLCYMAAINPRANSALGRLIDDAADRLVPEAIEMLTDKVMRFGREQKQLWILLAAHGCMRSKKDPSKRRVYMKEAVDKITRPYYKIMACQVDAPSPIGGMLARDKDAINGTLEYIPPIPPQGNGDMIQTDSTPLDLDEIAAWTFEDWSFNPADLAAAFPENSYPTASP